MSNANSLGRRAFVESGLLATTSLVASQVAAQSAPAVDSPKPREFSDYRFVALTRSAEGVVTMRLHTDQKEFVLTPDGYSDLARAFREVSEDVSNKVLILTGTGDFFIKGADLSGYGDPTKTARWLTGSGRARRMLQACIDVEIPVIAAINGPIPLRSDIALLADYVIADERAWFQDQHFINGNAPGDGIFVVWSELLGFNRARNYLLTGAKISAKELHALGVIAELHGPGRVLSRATELASELAKRRPALLRNTRQVMTRKFSRRISEGLAHGWPLEIISGLDRLVDQLK